VTRVLIDASDGNQVWGTIGVSENLIAASWRRSSIRSSAACCRPTRREGAAGTGFAGCLSCEARVLAWHAWQDAARLYGVAVMALC